MTLMVDSLEPRHRKLMVWYESRLSMIVSHVSSTLRFARDTEQPVLIFAVSTLLTYAALCGWGFWRGP